MSFPTNKVPTMSKPKWHAPWKLKTVICGHSGAVNCCAVDPNNQWFTTGSSDRLIRVWDLASRQLKISLTGHKTSVKGIAISPRHPYLFSCSNDNEVKCWDLEYNKVIRHYHGHLSAVHSLALHPTIDLMVTAGRDCTARVWDMRTNVNTHIITGHTKAIASVLCQATDPQIITGSHDSTIRLYDLTAGRSTATLKNHKKGVRALISHPTLNTFVSGSSDNIKQWKSNNGQFIQNLFGHKAIINCFGTNEDGVLVSGADNGSMHLWDWRTGYNFQRLQVPAHPGSMSFEAAIYSVTFDHSRSRLITTQADKTIKIYEEVDTSEPNHPIDFKPEIMKRQKYE
ncbi:hypothetical protein TKK_0007277 [Trichogramma kaykai]|uniref:Pleiotropic regulator 1 n=1 Tax=Trichogramma kaykai TaxID=54128 RepID=A0ABD2XAD7_9HYME